MGTPALSDGLVYVANFGGEVIAADESTGEVVWRTRVGAPVSGSMSAVADVVLVGDTDGVLHSLDAGTGDLRWQFETEWADQRDSGCGRWRSLRGHVGRVAVRG